MPEATIDEHGNPQPRKRKVSPNPPGPAYLNPVVLSESQSEAMRRRAHSNLWFGANRPISAHEPSHVRRGSSKLRSHPGRRRHDTRVTRELLKR